MHNYVEMCPNVLVEVEGEQEFIIDRIINSRVSADGGYGYLVHWQVARDHISLLELRWRGGVV